MDRRSFLKLGALSIPAVGSGWVAGARRLLSRAGPATPSVEEPGAWSPLVQLVGAAGDSVLPYSMLFDPTDATWTRIRPNMAGGRRWYATVTKVPDGRMLVTGGFYDFGLRPNRSVEIFDPAAYDAGKKPVDGADLQ